MSVHKHLTQNAFISALNLTEDRSDLGLFILDVNDISEEVAEKMELYRNDFFEINLIEKQYNFRFSIDEKVYHPRGEPYISFVAPSQLQTYQLLGDDPKARGYLIYLDKDFYRSLNLKDDFPFFKRNKNSLLYLSKAQSKALFQIVKDMTEEFKRNTPVSFEILKSFTRILLLKSSSYQSQEEDLGNYALDIVSRFESLVNQEYINHKTVSFYADKLAISIRQLSKITREVTGKSPLSMIHEVILNESKTFLSFSNLSTTEIAYALGYDEVAHFSRFFKRHTDISPSDFRIKSQNGKTIS